MIRCALFFCIITVATARAADPAVTNAVVLTPKVAPGVFPQCSRQTPSDITGYWTPTADEIATLESMLPKYVSALGRPAPPLLEYHRQYVGFISKGKKFIYVNFFHKWPLEHGQLKDWRKVPVNICDGGDYFWGIEFDTEKKQFFNAFFNGQA